MYRTLHEVGTNLPDGRAVDLEIKDNLLHFVYQAGRVDPDLVRDLDELSRHMTRSGLLDIRPDRLIQAPDPLFKVHFEAVRRSAANMAQGFGTRIGQDRKIPFFEIYCRWDLIDPVVIREMNEEILPVVCSVLVPVVRQVP
jgi:hypothetical protein